MKKSIFITGGAGYVGTTLIPMLLDKGYNVTVYDSLYFNNGDVLIPHISNPNFTFILGDVRDKEKLALSIKNQDVVIHLAAYVGYPLCQKLGSTEAQSVNVEGTENVIASMIPNQYLIYGSTGSNYGAVEHVCTEESPLNPLSIYGVTKTEAEVLVMARKNSTAFRFATAFGTSPRMRLDLLVNDMTNKCATDGYTVIYESHFMRTFIHVKDMCNSFIMAIETQDKMVNEVYNVGSDIMNHSKREVCEMIDEAIDKAYIVYADIGEDADRRNYTVSYDKIKKLGFNTTITVKEGIDELIKTIPLLNNVSRYRNI